MSNVEVFLIKREALDNVVQIWLAGQKSKDFYK